MFTKLLREGHIHCIAVLLDRGADIESKDSEGSTALHVAAQEGHIHLHSYAESMDDDGDTALHVAAQII